MKIAKFARGYNLDLFTFLRQYSPTDDGTESWYCGMPRISEWVEVDFPPRAPEEIIPAQLAVLDARKAEEVERHLRALAEIADARSKLLALTHQEVTA